MHVQRTMCLVSRVTCAAPGIRPARQVLSTIATRERQPPYEQLSVQPRWLKSGVKYTYGAVMSLRAVFVCVPHRRLVFFVHVVPQCCHVSRPPLCKRLTSRLRFSAA